MLQCITTVLKNFEDLNFVDDKSPAKTAKFTSLENLYVYGIQHACMFITINLFSACFLASYIIATTYGYVHTIYFLLFYSYERQRLNTVTVRRLVS